MIKSLYFDNTAYQYAYELERLIRNFSLPHRLEFYTDKTPDGTDYAYCCADNGKLSVTVSDNDTVYKESSDVCEPSDYENELCRLLCRCMERHGHTPLPWGILTGVRPVKYIRSIYETRDNAEEYLRNSLLVSDKKIRLANDVIRIQKPVLDSLDLRKISLYISIPFCPSRCSYCSFISASGEGALKLIDDYFGLLLKELDIYADIVKRFSLKVDTVYIGGGTPTTLSASQLDRLIDKLGEFDIANIREFTAEAGRPDTITEDKLRTLKNGGVRRISINPQSMNDSVLEAVGRRHTVKDVCEAFDIARKVGFDCINSDIIAGLPAETEHSFEASLQQLCELSPENITVHTLSLKRSSALFRQFGNNIGKGAKYMTDTAYDMLCEKGYFPYYLYRQKNIADNLENIGYCKDGCESIYNICIMEDVQTILAAGCGASTKLYDGKNVSRVINYKYPYEYISRFALMNERKRDIENFFGRKINSCIIFLIVLQYKKAFLKGNTAMDFKDEFDIISEKAKQLTDTGIRKADEVIGISKLKLRCIKIDALIKAKYTELGRTMYGMVKNDSSDADRIAQAVMDIDHLYKKMAQCNARIELMKKIVTCPVCGTKNRFSNTYWHCLYAQAGVN